MKNKKDNETESIFYYEKQKTWWKKMIQKDNITTTYIEHKAQKYWK